MILQNILLRCAKEEAKELVYHANGGEARYDAAKNVLHLRGANASFDTYFNVFPGGKYARYTPMGAVTLTLRLSGEAEVEVGVRMRTGEAVLCRETMHFAAQGVWQHTFSLDGLREEDCLFFRLHAPERGCIFWGGAWCGEAAEQAAVKIAVCICTFHREEYVYRNMESLCEALSEQKEPALAQRFAVFISDNGHTLENSRLPDKRIHLYPNKNYGGSGGFARAMLEAAREGSCTHILMQDDDIVLEPECVRRTLVFLSLCREEYQDLCLAGTMFTLEKPTEIVESGARWDGTIHSLKCGLDVTKPEQLLQSNCTEPADYGAWWYFAAPMAFVQKSGLSMPFFIKFDDIEFSLRNARCLVTLPGVGVWHEGFDKKYNACLEYYAERNFLVVDTLYPEKCSLRRGLVRGGLSLLRAAAQQCYNAADFRLKALEDYRKGPAFFLQQNEEKLNDELMQYSKSWMQAHAYAPGVTPEQIAASEKAPRKGSKKRAMAAIVLSYLIPGPFPRHKPGLVNIAKNDLQQLAGHGSLLQYNAQNGTAILTVASKKAFWRYLGRYLRMAAPVWLHAGRYEKWYRQHKAVLTSAEFWAAHLELNQTAPASRT